MQAFDFPFNRPVIEYPESSFSIRYGRGYTFATKPNGPDQLTVRLQFDLMFNIQNAAGVFDPTLWPELNMLRLQNFYEAHRLYEFFTYFHPTKGLLTCRFSKPLVTPRPVPGQVTVYDTMRCHQVEPFEIILITQP